MEAIDILESDEYNEFEINTSNICSEELFFYNDPDYKPWRKVPRTIIDELERAVRNALLRSTEPTVNYSPDDGGYMKDRFDRMFVNNNLEPIPFYHGYFVVAYDSPIKEKKKRSVSFSARPYMYLFSYDTQLNIKPGMVDDETLFVEEFDLLFAFGVRECDMMKVKSFLSYQLQKNFNNENAQFCEYVKQIERKFGSTLFTDELRQTVLEWISNNEKEVRKSDNKKIKTHLTVDQLAYLFKTLVDLNLISNENKNDVIAFAVQNFGSKRQAEISERSFNSKFYAPTIDAVEFWIKQFDNLSKLAIRDQQKLSA